MNVTARMDLLDQIGRALQDKYTFQDLDGYFGAMNIQIPEGNFGSKRVFSKQALKSVSDDILLKIARELNLNTHFSHGQLDGSINAI